MGWTDERIEALRKLWAEGMSASQIATALGGVSRNAVIGKIHRLGLSGRVKTARGSSGSRRSGGAGPSCGGSSAQPRVMAVGSTVVRVAEREAPAPQEAPVRRPAEVVPLRGGVTLLELRTASCRWPLGDPSDADFRFCGARTSEGDTYCAAHAERAFPARQRARRRD